VALVGVKGQEACSLGGSAAAVARLE